MAMLDGGLTTHAGVVELVGEVLVVSPGGVYALAGVVAERARTSGGEDG